MKPVIALVGRPNVGKSTLFNRLTRTRDALVADYPGLTRDRKYGDGRLGDYLYTVVDTGGIGENSALVRHKTLSHLSLPGFYVDRDLNQNHGRASDGRIDSSNSRFAILVIPTDEELVIAKAARAKATSEPHH